MICKSCNTRNAPLKRTCNNCAKILEGECFNNFTGKFGYRNADGSFTVNESKKDLIPSEFFAPNFINKVL